MARIPSIRRNSRPPRDTRRSLRLSLMVWFLGLALVPLVAMGTFGYLKARSSRQEEIQINLAAVSDIERTSVQDFFARANRELDHQSRLVANREFLTRMINDLEASTLAPRPWTRSNRWHELTSHVGHEITRFRNNSPWHDILILDRKGLVVFSCRQEDDLGSNVLTGPYSRTSFAEAVRGALDQRRMTLSGFANYDPSGGAPASFLVVPMNGADGEVLGLMAFQIASAEVARVTASHNLPVGEVQVRFLALQEPGAHLALLEKDSQPATHAYFNSVGESVYGNVAQLEILSQEFVLLTEVEAEAALAGLNQIRLAMLLMVALTAVMVVGAGQNISSRLVRPIVALGKLMKRVADGHEVDDLQVEGHNEVGDLADQFAVMIDKMAEARRSSDHQYRLQRSQFELNEEMRGEAETADLAQAILEFIGDYYGAQVGAFYLVKPGQRLVLAAQLGDADEDWPVRELREGQGLVGRAALRRRIEILRDIPPDHMQIRTAMGRSAPRTLLVAPFHLAGQVKGVMELGTLDEVSEEALEFLHLSTESVAVALDSSRSRERVHRLLDETRRQAGTLARQQKELQETNVRLAQSDRCKNEFLANMSHELRTPLNSMLLMSQVLSENQRGALDDKEVEAATTIRQAGEDLLAIINDILDLSKVEAGKLELVPDQVDLKSLVTDLKHLFKPLADGKNLELRTHLGPGVPASVFTDGLRLKQILKNLLNNACKFTDQGSIVFRVRRPSPTELAGLDGAVDQWVALSVADTGIGMSPEVLEQVFEAFNQGDGSIGRRFGGSGLGLSISHRLTELLEGHLAVSSVENKGTRFTLLLPTELKAAELPEPAGCTAEVQPQTMAACEPTGMCVLDNDDWVGRTFVLVDDEMRTVFRLGAELKQLGLAPEIIRTSEELTSAAGTLSAGTIVLVNPWCGGASGGGPQGAELLDHLRTEMTAPNTLIVALVPEGKNENLPEADAVLTKPVSAEQLLHACQVLRPVEGAVT